MELIRKEEGSDRRNKVKRRGTRRETKRKRLWRDETKGGGDLTAPPTPKVLTLSRNDGHQGEGRR